MKQLRKLSLKSARLMNDSEMKMIVGGSGSYTCREQNSTTCDGSCPPKIVYDNGNIKSVAQTCKPFNTGLPSPHHKYCGCV